MYLYFKYTYLISLLYLFIFPQNLYRLVVKSVL